MSEDSLASLEARYSRLERRVLGDEPFDDRERQIVEILSNANSMLDASRATQEKVALAMSRIDELDAAMAGDDEGGADALAAARAEVVLATTETIGHRIRQMKQLHKAAPALGSTEVAQAAQHVPRLSALAVLSAQESALAETESEAVRRMLRQYSALTNQLSRTFVRWDALVTEAELLANPRKPLDS